MWHADLVPSPLLTRRYLDRTPNAPPAFPVGDDFHETGFHGVFEVVGNGVGDGFVVDAFVAEALVIELEALEFHADFVGCVAQRDVAEVWVACDGTDAGELLGDVLNDVVTRGVGVVKTFEELGVWHEGNDTAADPGFANPGLWKMGILKV